MFQRHQALGLRFEASCPHAFRRHASHLFSQADAPPWLRHRAFVLALRRLLRSLGWTAFWCQEQGNTWYGAGCVYGSLWGHVVGNPLRRLVHSRAFTRIREFVYWCGSIRIFQAAGFLIRYASILGSVAGVCSIHHHARQRCDQGYFRLLESKTQVTFAFTSLEGHFVTCNMWLHS